MLCTSWMCVICVCKLKYYIIHREIEGRALRIELGKPLKREKVIDVITTQETQE